MKNLILVSDKDTTQNGLKKGSVKCGKSFIFLFSVLALSACNMKLKINPNLKSGSNSQASLAELSAFNQNADLATKRTPAAASGLPDLVVTSFTSTPANPVAGEPVAYSAVVTNNGSAATPKGKVIGISFSTDGIQEIWSDTYSASLAPGASVTLTTNSGPAGLASIILASGSHQVQANDILRFAESNTANNIKTFALSVAASSGPIPSPALPADPNLAGPFGEDAGLYMLTVHDEFQGSSLDTNKWKDHIWYDPATSTQDHGVSNGSLKIWPQQDFNGQFKERILVTDGKFYQTMANQKLISWKLTQVTPEVTGLTKIFVRFATKQLISKMVQTTRAYNIRRR